MDLVLVVFKLNLGLQIVFNIPLLVDSLRFRLPTIPIVSVSTDPIEKNIFNINDAEPDKTPPRIIDYASSVCKADLFIEYNFFKA